MSSLVSAAKQCGETQEFPIVIRAWKHLDLPLRRTIDEPIEGTTIKGFMELLVMKQSNWVDSYDERQSSFNNTPPIPGRSTDDTRLLDIRYAPTYPETSCYPQQIMDRAALIPSLNSSSLDDCPNNKVHTHIRASDSVQAEAYFATDLPSIEPIAKPTHAPGCALRSWKNPAAQPFLTPHGHIETTCIAKNDSKKVNFVIVSPSDSHENAFWRDHGEHVGRPEDHG